MTDPSFTRFSAVQFAELPVSATAKHPNPNRQSLEAYLSESRRVVATMAQGSRWEALGDQLFQLRMRSLSIFGLTFEPTVDLKVWLDNDQVLRLRSQRCDLVGLDYISQQFSLDLFGRLKVIEQDGEIHLKGIADLAVSLVLPAPISYLPENVITTAGNGLLASVLKTIHQRLCENLVTDYHQWAQQEARDVASPATKG
ncbi:MAG: DUF1997 domain-containing protein [Cyanobacteria bacterium P01_D01_bin.73]